MKTSTSSLQNQVKPKASTLLIKKFASKKSNHSYKKLKKIVQGLSFQAMSLSFQSKMHQDLLAHFAEDLIQLSKISQPIALNHFICRFSEKLADLKIIDQPLMDKQGVSKNTRQFAVTLSSTQFPIEDQLDPKWVAIGKAEEWLNQL